MSENNSHYSQNCPSSVALADYCEFCELFSVARKPDSWENSTQRTNYLTTDETCRSPHGAGRKGLCRVRIRLNLRNQDLSNLFAARSVPRRNLGLPTVSWLITADHFFTGGTKFQHEGSLGGVILLPDGPGFFETIPRGIGPDDLGRPGQGPVGLRSPVRRPGGQTEQPSGRRQCREGHQVSPVGRVLLLPVVICQLDRHLDDLGRGRVSITHLKPAGRDPLD
jgi:hypothetical protein